MGGMVESSPRRLIFASLDGPNRGVLVLPSMLKRRWRPEGGTVLHQATNYQKPAAHPSKHRPVSTTSNEHSSVQTNQNKPKSLAAQNQSEIDTDWREALIDAMGQFETDQGVSLFLNKSDGIPITLVLERCTPGRARRALNELGQFLTRIPTPPRVNILFQNCEAANVPWSKMVLGCLSSHIGRNSARMVGQPERVDLFFNEFEPRYSEKNESSNTPTKDPD